MNDKKLTKSATNRMISGVCGGIGEYFHLDATLIRLIWAILTVGGVGSGLILYIIAAIVIPEPEFLRRLFSSFFYCPADSVGQSFS